MDLAPGFMSDDEVAELQRLARDKTVLEIGTWKGRSACAMAAVAREVWAIDTFRGDRYTGRGWFLPEFLENAYRLGVWEKIRFIGCPWEEMLPGLRLSRFDLVFYDADHDYAPTARAGRIIAPRLLRDQVLVFHDYSAAYPQVQQAVQETAADFDRAIRVVGTLAILEALEFRPCGSPA